MEQDRQNFDDSEKELADIKRELKELKAGANGNQEKNEKHTAKSNRSIHI